MLAEQNRRLLDLQLICQRQWPACCRSSQAGSQVSSSYYLGRGQTSDAALQLLVGLPLGMDMQSTARPSMLAPWQSLTPVLPDASAFWACAVPGVCTHAGHSRLGPVCSLADCSTRLRRISYNPLEQGTSPGQLASAMSHQSGLRIWGCTCQLSVASLCGSQVVHQQQVELAGPGELGGRPEAAPLSIESLCKRCRAARHRCLCQGSAARGGAAGLRACKRVSQWRYRVHVLATASAFPKTCLTLRHCAAKTLLPRFWRHGDLPHFGVGPMAQAWHVHAVHAAWPAVSRACSLICQAYHDPASRLHA